MIEAPETFPEKPSAEDIIKQIEEIWDAFKKGKKPEKPICVDPKAEIGKTYDVLGKGSVGSVIVLTRKGDGEDSNGKDESKELRVIQLTPDNEGNLKIKVFGLEVPETLSEENCQNLTEKALANLNKALQVKVNIFNGILVLSLIDENNNEVASFIPETRLNPSSVGSVILQAEPGGYYPNLRRRQTSWGWLLLLPPEGTNRVDIEFKNLPPEVLQLICGRNFADDIILGIGIRERVPSSP